LGAAEGAGKGGEKDVKDGWKGETEVKLIV